MITEVDEAVTVGAVFDKGQAVVPKWFVWHGRKYVIHRVTFSWKVKEGIYFNYHFSVTDGVNLFELCYAPQTLAWKLMSASPM
jgi:hypothetical protein